MATLKHQASGRTHLLSSSHTVGRAPGCLLRLDSRKVSAEHAAFRWTGSHWEIRDLGSRNGTFVNDDRLTAGEPAIVSTGSLIAFGDVGDRFELTDDAAPAAVARSDDGESQVAEDGMLVLPDPEAPEITVFDDGSGRWFAESNDGQRRPVKDRERLRSGGRWWQLDIPLVIEKTLQADGEPRVLDNVGLRLSVSRDEEHVELTLLHDGETTPLPPRAHAYLLLTLARARIDDQNNPRLPEAEHGWVYVTDLVRMLDTNENQLNVAIFRARRQLASARVAGATALFERRTNARQIRLGLGHVEIVSL